MVLTQKVNMETVEWEVVSINMLRMGRKEHRPKK